eukprot:CAMPEP_0177761824 /NCGR_PEP_ID=MMETSP0491_2-20121128/6014_1 /TAXON_ID=63592 /ORGANISM="Tetraselmis chuii, Strain PLY429" /LENGTH=463 /DNA_ID=CAMNT_0019277831 /DNA_START=311 /DNA_END=1698 /DNA_ORIENTATION=-
MVLESLGMQISQSLAGLSQVSVIDEEVLNKVLKDIARALLTADVNFRIVGQMRDNIRKRVNVEKLAAGLNKEKIIHQAVNDELVAILDGESEDGKGPKEPKKADPTVVMFVGLQGSGKTTTCMKYAYYYKKKGLKPAMICADTYRAGAFDQLKQNSTKAQIPFYGSYNETDPAVIAKEGVERFQAEKNDLIIVDTSGRHKQEAALFEEMQEVATAVNPDLVIFVMDGSIGQAAFDQAKAFKDSVAVGACILTKMDGNAKGGGALSAVAATKSPIIFYEHMDEFEPFESKPFVGRLLGKGDWSGFMNKIQDVIPEDKQPELIDTIAKGQFSMRILYEQFSNILKMGPMSQVMSLIPGFSNALMPKGQEKESQAKIKRMMCLMDSMTDEELDSTNIKLLSEPSRIERIARGAGRRKEDMLLLLEEYKRLAKLFQGAMKGMKLPKNMKAADLNRKMGNMDMSQISR